MTFSLADIDAQTALLRDFEGADVASLARPELLRVLKLASAGRNAWDLLIAQLAGEVARRSAPEDGAGGLARQQGFGSAGQLVASVLGSAPGEGHALVRAGGALATPGPLSSGLKQGVTVAKADLIARSLAPLEGDTRELEERLSRAAAHLDYPRLKLACAREVARFDAAHQEAAERRHHDQRSLALTERAFGQVHIEGDLPAAQGAIVITFLDAQVKAALQAQRDDPRDTRTPSQVRADSLVALAAHGLDCDSPATGVKATIIVRVNAQDVETQTGTATCDALSAPISLTALRELTMDATVMRMVVNAKSQVLDLGREHRLFSWAQRMALAERDGGCAKCHAPISHCITHHIRWWHRDSGPTDISNGVLLCVRCHTQVHHDGWGIEVDAANQVWFTPPPHIDPDRCRILGGIAALAV
jgi:hypothetical protein